MLSFFTLEAICDYEMGEFVEFSENLLNINLADQFTLKSKDKLLCE
jgi:hypothetical protein